MYQKIFENLDQNKTQKLQAWGKAESKNVFLHPYLQQLPLLAWYELVQANT